MYQRQRPHHHRPASQGVRQDLHNNLATQNVPSVNIMPVDKQADSNQKMSRNAAQAFHSNNNQQQNNSAGLKQIQNNQQSRVQQQQQAHSMTRDLDAMGLMTQVKKGDDARLQKKNAQNNNSNRQAQQTQPPRTTSQGKVTKNQDPNQLNLTNQQMYYLLKPQSEAMKGRKTLLLDVDETLVHSSFTPTDKADIVLPIDIEGRTCNIYVQVRPYCCEFIVEVGKYFEVVIFTASLSKYAIPLMDILDHQNVAPQRLFREHCTYFNGQFVKDMQRVGRRMEDTIIIDNSPNSYQFQPENGLPILSWYDDPSDTELMRFVPALKLLAQVDDIRPVILQSTFDNEWNVDMAIRICESLLILKEKQNKEAEKQKEQEETKAKEAAKQRKEQELPHKQLETKDNRLPPPQISNTSSTGPPVPHSDKTTKNEANIDLTRRESDEAIVISKHKDSKHGSKSVRKETEQDSQAKNINESQPERSTIYDDKTRETTKDIEPKSMLASSKQKESSRNQMGRLNTAGGNNNAPRSGNLIANGPGRSNTLTNAQITKKEASFTTGSGKKSQPNQTRSYSKPRPNTQDTTQGFKASNANTLTNVRPNNRYHEEETTDGVGESQDGLSKTEEERMRNQVNSSEQFKIIKQRRMQKELINSEKLNAVRQSRQQSQKPNKDQTDGIESSQPKKKTTNSLNPDKLKQYLISSQQAGQANLDSVAFNKNEGGRVLIKSSSRNLQDHQLAVSHHTKQHHSHLNSVGNVVMKNNVMNSRTQNSVVHHGSKMGSGSAQFQTSVALGDKKESFLGGANSSLPRQNTVQQTSSGVVSGQQAGLKNTTQSELRNSLKNGKRRANSNHTAAENKKVNLDKFLSVVQQRSNFTPSSQLNGRVQPMGAGSAALRGGASDLDKKYAQQMAVMNHKAITKSAAVAERKQRIAGTRQGSNATEIAFGQKKLSLKGSDQQQPAREVVNKSGGVRGIQLNHNDIIFSKTMNLSQFLQAQTKGISGSNTTTHQNQPTSSPFVVAQSQKPRLVAQEMSRQVASGSQKRNSSNQNNSRVAGQAAWVTSTTRNANVSTQSQLNSKKNPYAVNQGASLNQIIGYQPGSVNNGSSSTKYQTTQASQSKQKQTGSVHQLQNHTNAASSLTQKRMSAGSINVASSRSGVAMLVNGQTNMTQRNVSNSQGKIKAQLKKISQSSAVNPGNNALSERENIHRGQSANREYQRSPGKIFNGFQGASAMIVGPHSQSTKNQSQKQIQYKSGIQNQPTSSVVQAGQLSGKRTSKPQLMSELTLSLKNKKGTASGNKGVPSGYTNLIKPLVSAGRIGPQTTKASSNILSENFSSRSYTQRVVAAQAAAVAGNSSHFSQIQNQQNQSRQANAAPIQTLSKQGKTGKNNATTGDLNQSDNKMTPRKKIIKLVSNAGGNKSTQNVLNRGGLLQGQQATSANTQGSGNAGANYATTHATLLNNYYQSLQRSNNEQSMGVTNIELGSNSQVTAQGVQQHEIKQRQQIFSMLNDFEKTSRFNKEQIKNFGSPKNANPSPVHPQQQQSQQASTAQQNQNRKLTQNQILHQTNQTGATAGIGKGAKQPKIRQQDSK